MAYGVMPQPGGPYLCAGPCGHRDCAALRELAATPCHYCDKLVEPGQEYFLEDHKPVHTACAYDAVKQP